MGYLPIAMRNYLVRLGWAHGDQEIFSTEEMIKAFDLPQIGRSLEPTTHVTSSIGYIRLHGRNYDQWFEAEKCGRGRAIAQECKSRTSRGSTERPWYLIGSAKIFIGRGAEAEAHI